MSCVCSVKFVQYVQEVLIVVPFVVMVRRRFGLEKRSGKARLEEGSWLAVEVFVPSGPLVLLQVAEWSIAALVLNVKKIGAFGQDQIDQFEVGSVCPAGIVKRCSTIVVGDLDRTAVLQHALQHFKTAVSTDCM